MKAPALLVKQRTETLILGLRHQQLRIKLGDASLRSRVLRVVHSRAFGKKLVHPKFGIAT